MEKRIAFKMKLKQGCKQEYIKRHDAIWAEIAALIKQSGISDYSIFLDEETNTLFGVQKQSGGVSSQELGSVEIQQKWWNYMSDIMEVNPDNSPVTKYLEEVFYLA
ncbi:MAG: L-rhamnose mutarotase [Candidatus Symbiothrix sp.]|jgi:L-rhamnose mutarotase|nr:L-rhamnose mutarotase [Candidatus Symbiothrix sp.]